MNFNFEFFFDKPAVLKAVDRGRRDVLSKIGAYVMTTAKRSMRSRKRPAAPGQPPSVHVGYLRQFLFFAYDPINENVVVGPALFKTTLGNTTIPQALEYGGDLVHWKTKQISHYHAFPFMQPALKTNVDKFQFFRDAIK